MGDVEFMESEINYSSTFNKVTRWIDSGTLKK